MLHRAGTVGEVAPLANVSHLLNDCDDAQRAAITSDAAPLFVRAGAGSGKTRVLTRRVAWRLANASADPSHTLVVTFTRKAASELRRRLAALGADGPVTAGTLHAIALAELRRLALDRGASLPIVLESRGRLIERLAAQGKLAVGPNEGLDEVVGEIDWAKARLVDPEHYPDAARRARRHTRVNAPQLAECYATFEREKSRRGVLDFDDLLVRLADEIDRDPDLAAAQRWRFRHFFLDELQDLSAAQLRLLDAWLGGRADLFAVGDGDQAIYGFGGALESALSDLLVRYPAATVLDLDANYRSSPQIVAFAGALRDGRGETIACGEDGPLPTVTAYPTADEEANGIAAALLALRRRGVAERDCAVLARTNAQLRLLSEALEHAGVARRASLGAFLSDPDVMAAMRSLRGARSPERLRAALEGLDHEVAEGSSALRQLAEIGAEYLLLDPIASGEGLATYLRQSARTEPGPGEGGGVEVLSFHRAKGLEWPVVFVAGLEDGYVPIAHARTPAEHEEELRLLYVALSRAGRELHCSFARRRVFGGMARERTRSPLLDGPVGALRAMAPAGPPGSEAGRALAEARAHLRRTLRP